ncbi:hypothetical protein H310_05653 [Aphanomyces invadans]|uniref:Uncharacterized protein n=1 Tax=Aphanomyces invadans TaxID=157072 RepID=A0A024UBJ0_9STRA|nr:hypothetical protein H310_05653 [Aphanomyces invadans]ETW03257.1 hypothetical protein H310_05653 [Aphanomyces invadans]|eukprot:XP_008868641.1 hypothetical protein H310_05653 [Aphanomyces invadans]
MAFSACSTAAVRAALAKACVELGANEDVYQVDIYRRLAQEAKVLYDTEKIRDRVKEHPLTADMAKQHPQLVEFVVEDSAIHCDTNRNVFMEGVVTFDRSLAHATQHQHSKKKAKVDHDRMQLVYTYDRQYAGKQFGTTVAFGVHVVFGYGQKIPLVECAFRTSGRYPVSYYARQAEQDCASPNDDAKVSDGDDGSDAEEGGTDEGNDAAGEPDDADASNDASDDEEVENADDEASCGDAMEVRVLGDDEKDWEYVESFEFQQETLEQVCAWLAEPSALKVELSPQDALSFVLVMPFHEDEFAVDDRIFDIVFNEDSDDSDDGNDGSGSGEDDA